MKAIYTIRSMKNKGKVSFSVTKDKKVIAKGDEYEMIRFLKAEVARLHKIGMIADIRGGAGCSYIVEQVYSYSY
jgi:hypothetical protein